MTIGETGLGETASIGVDGPLYATSSYQDMRNFAAGTELSTYADRFFCDDEANSIWADGDYLWFGTNPPHSHAAVPGGEVLVFRDLPSASTLEYSGLGTGTYRLSADTSVYSFALKSNAVVTLCLNGHTLTTKNGYNSRPILTVPSGATLTICDCQGGGKITRTPDSNGKYQDSHIKVSGTLNLYGGSITGNNNTSNNQWTPTEYYGGGVHVENGGQFNMYGGSITDNTVENGSGGGVYVAKNGTFTMYDGEISGNTSSGTRAADGGGGVYVAAGGTASLLGGVITDNKVTATTTTAGLGGGVYAGGSVTVGGLAYVQNNTKGTAPNETPSNVYLPNGQTIAVSGETSLETGAKIGVTTQTAPTDGAAVDIITGSGTGLKGHFTSDNAEYGFQDGGSGLQMIPDAGGSGGDDGGDDPSITRPENPPTSFTVIFAYPGSDGQTATITMETNDEGKLTGQTLPTPEREGYLFGGWYLDDDPVTADTVFTDSATVTAQWTLCDHTSPKKTVTTPATCSAEGQAKYACSCGASWTETIAILDHSWGQWTRQDENQHTRTCSVGKETQTADHIWEKSEEKSTAPTCKAEGRNVYVCSVCSAEKTETLPITSHNYSGEWKKDASGHWQACADCETPAAAQKHLYTEEVTQPTCDEAGTMTLTCSVCGYETTETIPALGHSFKSEWEKDADEHWHVCAIDSAHTSEKLAHSWDGGTVLTPATTTDKGTTRYTCIDCGQTKEEQDIPVVVPVTYTLTYTPGENASGEDVVESGKTAGESVTLPDCDFTRTGYAFTGWECGGSTYQAGDTFTMLPGDITFTAQWRLNLPITLQPGDTVVLEDGASVSRSGDGTTVTITKNQVDVSNVPDGAEAQENTPETTVTVPADGIVTLVNDPVSKPGLDEDGNETTIETNRTVLEIPGGSKVQTKSDDPEIAIPEGETAKVTMNGDVYDLPAGTTVTQGDSTITVSSPGGSVSTGGDVTFDDGEGQVTVQNGDEAPVSVTVPKDGGVSVTPDENTQRFGGTVTGSDGAPVENATVELRQGNTVYGKAKTDSSGNYTFLSVYPGIYDLVVSEGGRTLTKLVEITGEAPIGSVTLTDHASVLTIPEGTNLAVVVGGLDDAADAQQNSITMTVEQKEEAEADGAEAIRTLAGSETVLDYLDVKVEKDGATLTETGTVLEIILPFEFANVEGGVTVYRAYDGTAQALTESEGGAEGTFCADSENGMIRVYASKFSTYALGYAKPYAGPEVSVAPGETKEADDGTTVTSKENEDGTVAVTITYPGGGKTNIVLPEDSDKTVILNRDTGEVTVPEGSTVNTDPAVTLPQGGTVDKNGDITVPANGTVTITDGTNTATITLPGGAVTPSEEGGLHVPAGTTVQTGDGPVITLPESGEGGTVFPGGAVYGTPVQVDNTTITITKTDPGSGDIITSPDGEVTLPGGTTANVDENGDGTPNTTVTTPADGGATVKPDGEIDLPKGGTVTQGETTVTVPTTGGTVGKEESGETTVPGGSTVQTGEDGKPVTLPQGGKVDESGNVTGESVKVGDTTVTATDPDKPVTADPTGSTTIPAGATAEVEQGGTTTTVTPGAGDDATVKPDGGIDLPAGGKVTISGESGKPDTTVTVGEGGGTVTPDPDGTVEVPAGSSVQTGTGPVITLPESGGGGTVNKGGDVTVPTGGSATVTDKDGNETTVTPGAGGDATVKPDGEIDLPAGGKVTVTDGEGGTTEITAPTGGGTVSTDQDGNLVVPGGSTVTKADGTTETVPEEGGIVKPDGTVEQKPMPPSPPASSGGGGTTYPPVIEQLRHGKVTVSPADPQSGDKVTITVTPEDGFEPRTVTITDSNGNPVKVTKNVDGTYTYIQPEGTVTISVTMGLACPRDENCPLHDFTDASATAWYHDGVHYCVENGLMAGLGGSRFGPNNTLTRGMLARILYNRENTPEVTGPNPFADVKEGAWYTNAVIWAAENDIVAGYGNGKYGPNDPITREQLATILWRYNGSPQSTGSLDQFTDGKKASDYAVSALQWAVEQKIVSGKGNGILDPKGKATRAEVASMLMRYCESAGF